MGELALYRDPGIGEPIMQAGKPLAVLVYVALAPEGTAPRDHVARLFWRSSPLQDARHSLRQALYRLRSAAEGTELVSLEGTTLQVSDHVRLDCLEGEHAAEAGDPVRAYELLGGDFLGGFTIPDSWELEEWAETHRTRFNTLWATLAHELAEQHLAKGKPQQALDIAERLAELRPFDEEAIRLVMSTLAGSGRHATAAARFEAYAQLLAGDDEEPGEELLRYATELGRYLRSRRLEDDGHLPFVGREEEWAAVESAWQAACRGSSETVLVEGSAGLGKTRLLDELRRRADAARALILAAKCYEPEQSVAYGALGDALAGMVGQPGLEEVNHQWLAEAARILPGLHEQFPDLPPPASPEGSQAGRRRLHEAVARLLELAGKHGPVLLAVDDIHWADTASLELLHFLSHRIRNAGILIVASYRPAELSPMARRYARSLCSSGLAQLIVVEPLTEEHVRELLENMGRFEDEGLASTLARHLHRQSAGSPLFLSELIDVLARQRLLFLQDGEWVMGREEAIQRLPHTIGKMLTDRLDVLAPWMRACAEVAAVAAGELHVEVLARALDISEPRAELALSVLEEERLVRRTSEESFDLIHDELRRLIYQDVSDERRRVLHGAVGSALEALGEAKRPGGAARLVYHFDQANDPVRARKYAFSAAEEASALSVPEAARRHLDIAAAHAPRALAPSSLASARPGDLGQRLLRARWVAVAAVAGVILAAGLLAVTGDLFRFSDTPPVDEALSDYRQGTLYLGMGPPGATNRVRWPDDPDAPAEIEPVTEWPADLPPPLFPFPVSERGETHNKIAAVREGDTILLTDGRTDDAARAWSPDRRTVLLTRGWRADEARFVAPLFLLDTATRQVRQITEAKHLDQDAEWSPLGTQIAYVRDSLRSYTLWLIDADGGRPRDLSTRFDLPAGRPTFAFAPDGARIAVALNPEPPLPGTVRVLDLVDGLGRTRTVLPDRVVRDIAWSPDGEWLVWVAEVNGRGELWRIPVEGGDGPELVAALPGDDTPGTGFSITAWTGGVSRRVERVVIDAQRLTLRSGQGARLAAGATDQAGIALPVPLRWSVLDETIARVDDRGFVIGLHAGATSVLASAGGFRSDTVPVQVSYAPVDTLLMEDWGRSIDSLRWRPFGQPRSLTRELQDNGDSVFFSNGDYNHGSGVISVERFDPWEDGLTIEVPAYLRFTGRPWQVWELGAVFGEPVFEAGTEFGRMHATLGVEGPHAEAAEASWTCGAEVITLAPTSHPEGAWMQIALQIRPDSVAECFVNGALLGSMELRDLPASRLSVVLRGLSVATDLYHGPVVVTRGLRR